MFYFYQPILTYFNGNHGLPTIIIESDNSFVAPHIIIEEAPLRPPWESEVNRCPVQDYDDTRWLAVPSSSSRRRRHQPVEPVEEVVDEEVFQML